MSIRYALIIAILLLMLASTIPYARGQGFPEFAYVIDCKDMQDCFGVSDDRAVALINVSPTVSLNHAFIIMGSEIDALEKSGFDRYLSNHSFDSRLILSDDTESIYGASTDDFYLVLVGGPEHNAYTKKFLEQGILNYRETNITGPGMVIEAITAPSGHTVVVIGSAASYPRKGGLEPKGGLPPDNHIPAAAIAAGAGIGLIGVYFATFWSHMFEFLYGFISTYAGEVASEKETEIRKIHASHVKQVAFFGYSWRELVVAMSCLVLFSIAFVIADRMTLLPGNILFYLVVGGFVVIAHDLGHRLIAYRLKVNAEFKFWGLGSATMLLTSWMFGLVFAQPSRVVIEKGEHKAEDMASVMLAGPAISLALSIIFLLMTPLGEAARSIGLLGFSMNMVTVVYSLMPFDPMDGKSIFAWNRAYWAILFIPITLLFIVATYIVV